MAVTKVEIRRGAYYDSLVLMQLQVALTSLPGVRNAGVMMGLDTNKEVLKESGLLTPEAKAALFQNFLVGGGVSGKPHARCQRGLSHRFSSGGYDRLVGIRHGGYSRRHLVWPALVIRWQEFGRCLVLCPFDGRNFWLALAELSSCAAIYRSRSARL